MSPIETLKFYIFDWDDNVLCLDSQVFIEKYNSENNTWLGVSIGTHEYSLLAKDLNLKEHVRFPQTDFGENDYNKAFINFSDLDNEPNEIFLLDCISALEKKHYGSSFSAFKKCLAGGHLFMICTARGHNPITIKKVVEYMIENVLSPDERSNMLVELANYYKYFHSKEIADSELIDWYLNNNFYIGVSSNYFINSVLKEKIEVSKAKAIAVEYFMKRVSNMQNNFPGKINKVKVGVSDDSRENLDEIVTAFKNNISQVDVQYFVYDTSKGSCGTHQYRKLNLNEYEPRR